jgi:hypothetical protein
MRHIYRITFADGSKVDLNYKKELINFLKSAHEVIKIEWYRSNGFWIDMTNIYIK